MKRVVFYWLNLIIFFTLLSPAAAVAKNFSATGLTYSDSKSMVSILNFMGNNQAQRSCPSTTAPCDLIATASNTKGRINLSWRYTGRPFKGFFLVERSTNRKTWSVVSTCQRYPTTTSTSYSCSDSRLTSLTTYYYRACAITLGSKCGTTNLTSVVSARAP
jgi:hypothetical protein